MGVAGKPEDGSHHDEVEPIPPGTFGFGFPSAVSRRALLAGGGAVALGALLAACGGDDNTATGGGATTAKAPGGATATTAGATAGTSGGTATASGGKATPEGKTETLTIGLQSLEEQYVDPHWAVGGLIFPLTWAISDTLYRLDENAQYVPGLATAYEISSDQLTWTFTLRDDVKMHDGTPFTATDMKTAIDRILQGADYTHYAIFKSYVKAANVVDPTHIAIVTGKPYATLVTDMPAPIPTGYYGKVGDAAFRKAPMSCGAWKFTSQALNADVRYDRFDDYWDQTRKPNFRKLVFQIIPDESSRVAGIQTGSLDVAWGLTHASTDQFKNNDKIKPHVIKDTGIAYLMAIDNVFPDKPSPLKNLDVRKALIMAVDRDGLSKSLYGGYAHTSNSPIPPVMLGYDASVKPLPYDPAGAKALLAKSGNSNLSLTLNAYNATSTIPDVNKLVETVASLWKEIGVTATLNMADAGTILPAWRAKQLHGAGIIGGPVYFYYEPSRLTLSFFSSLAPYTTVKDPTLDALSDKINQTVDKAERTKLGKQLSDLLSQQLWGEGLVTVSSLALFGPNVANWTTITGCPYANVSWLRST